jgi:enoyl-CoA hydratase/carnithine racemase
MEQYSTIRNLTMSPLLEDSPAAGVLRLRIHRPEARNALSLELRQALAARFAAADADDGVRAVVVAGAEKVFAAGADLKVLKLLSPVEMHRLGYHRLWQAIADFRKPAIAAVRGFALGGGCELALHCDMIVAGRSATFGLPEIKVGIMPGAGGTQRLVRAVGKYRAMRLLMTGDLIKGPQAAEWGLVSHLVEDAEVEDEAVALAARLAAGPALALEFIKEAVLTGADLPLAAGLAIERKSLHLLFDTADQKEGMSAFAESRAPRFGAGD